MKCIIYSTLSEPNARCLLSEVKNFNLNTPMENPKYMLTPLNLIPQEIIDEYKLLPLLQNGHIYICIDKGMYGLTKAGIIANKLLAKRLTPYGYFSMPSHTRIMATHLPTHQILPGC